jgi:flagella synthesis protein FlgN
MNTPFLQLKNLLEQESSLVEQFISILQREAEALTQTESHDALSATTSEKNHFAALLVQSEQTREAQLKVLGFGAGKTGLDAACVAHPELQEVCHKLIDLASQADQYNAANGAIIDTYLKHNQEMLDTLYSLANRGNLYDASGRTKAVGEAKKGIKAG